MRTPGVSSDVLLLLFTLALFLHGNYRLLSSSMRTLKSSLSYPELQLQLYNLFSDSITLIAGAVGFALVIHSLSKKSLKILGNQF